jgi:hypothetical protein
MEAQKEYSYHRNEWHAASSKMEEKGADRGERCTAYHGFHFGFGPKLS